MIPPNVSVDLSEPVKDFWQRRLEFHTNDFYRDCVLAKMPEDLRTYQHLIEESKPEVILEIGSYAGGSALWFADQLSALLNRTTLPLVVSLDVSPVIVRDDRVVFITGDVRDPAIQEQVEPYLRDRQVMVSEDSEHSYESTLASLTSYSHFVRQGGWFVVEDGIVDVEELRLPQYRGGIDRAIKEFLETEAGSRFKRLDISPYGITTCQNGWLRATA